LGPGSLPRFWQLHALLLPDAFDPLQNFELVAEWDGQSIQMRITQLQNSLHVFNAIIDKFVHVFVLKLDRRKEGVHLWELP